MLNGRFGSSGYVGIDIGARSVKMLQLRESNGLKVVGAARFDAPGRDTTPEQIAARWQHALATGGFTGRSCVVSLPREIVHIQAVRLPSMPDHELREASRWEAAQRFNLDVNTIVADFMRTGATLQGKESRDEVLLIAASSELIRQHVQPLIDVGLRPVAVDVAAAALGRIFSRRARREKDRHDTRAVLEIGYGGSTVLILRGADVSMCKPIEIGGRHFDQAVAEHLQVEPDAAADLRRARLAREAGDETDAGNEIDVDPSTDRAVYEAVRPLMGTLARELTMCLRYYGVTFRGAAPKQVMLAGGDSTEPRLREAIAESCNVEVCCDDAANTLSELHPAIQAKLRGSAGSHGAWAVAAGLSIRAFLAKPRQKPMRRAA